MACIVYFNSVWAQGLAGWSAWRRIERGDNPDQVAEPPNHAVKASIEEKHDELESEVGSKTCVFYISADDVGACMLHCCSWLCLLFLGGNSCISHLAVSEKTYCLYIVFIVPGWLVDHQPTALSRIAIFVCLHFPCSALRHIIGGARVTCTMWQK